jgi:hypothetical protein
VQIFYIRLLSIKTQRTGHGISHKLKTMFCFLLTSNWFLSWVTVRPSRFTPPKRRFTFIGLHEVVSRSSKSSVPYFSTCETIFYPTPSIDDEILVLSINYKIFTGGVQYFSSISVKMFHRYYNINTNVYDIRMYKITSARGIINSIKYI